uniref:Uncharacterized protein n=1 Tax=Romanomermis culicivorax TaxID=13658 RepID=A0A915IM08_ROMCU
MDAVTLQKKLFWNKNQLRELRVVFDFDSKPCMIRRVCILYIQISSSSVMNVFTRARSNLILLTNGSYTRYLQVSDVRIFIEMKTTLTDLMDSKGN